MSTYAVIIEDAGANLCAHVPDLPGCVAAGHTVEEVTANIHEAIEAHIASMIEHGEENPMPSSPVLLVDVTCEQPISPSPARYQQLRRSRDHRWSSPKNLGRRLLIPCLTHSWHVDAIDTMSSPSPRSRHRHKSHWDLSPTAVSRMTTRCSTPYCASLRGRHRILGHGAFVVAVGPRAASPSAKSWAAMSSGHSSATIEPTRSPIAGSRRTRIEA
ncbi:MAG: type II toxin-antitoxin system HicB family antitoxin [Acidobacteria bacterium]|nr:type II toxin-antitoxin system HicB family antitoxin [Acidobacteriota bacterium]